MAMVTGLDSTRAVVPLSRVGLAPLGGAFGDGGSAVGALRVGISWRMLIHECTAMMMHGTPVKPHRSVTTSARAPHQHQPQAVREIAHRA
jgi:hypothetical protein